MTCEHQTCHVFAHKLCVGNCAIHFFFLVWLAAVAAPENIIIVLVFFPKKKNIHKQIARAILFASPHVLQVIHLNIFKHLLWPIFYSLIWLFDFQLH